MTSRHVAATKSEKSKTDRRGRCTSAPVIWAASLALAFPALSGAHVYQYDNTTPPSGGAIPTITGGSNTSCDNGTSSLNVPFVVSDSFTATTIAVGLNISHTERGDIRARLAAPDGTVYTLLNQGTDTDDNYDIQVTSNDDSGAPGTGPLDDNTTDPTAEPFFNRIVTGVAGLDGVSEAALGTWTLRVCDRDGNGVTGTLNRARLVLLDATAATSVCTSRINYEWGNNGNDVTFNSATTGDITITQAAGDRLNFAGGFGDNHVTLTGTVNGETGYYSLFMDAASIGGTQAYETLGQLARFNFSQQVHDLQFSLIDSDQADDDFEDVMRVEGSSGGAMRRFQRNIGTAHQVAGDMIEGDSGTTGAAGTSTYIFDRTVDTMRVYYFEGGDRGATDAGDQFTGITNLLFCAFDYGDAPNTYGTQLAGGGRHLLGDRNVWLGTVRPDGESNGQPNTAATADDVTSSGPGDEDGTQSGLFPVCPNNGTYTMSVNASNATSPAASAFLVGYIDWNRDGDFGDAGERSATVTVPQANADPAAYVVTWSSVPANCGPNTNATYARFRISTDQASVEASTGFAPNGEVEDYQITAGTLPVTIAMVDSERRGDTLRVYWTTASESGNVAFRIWAMDGRGGRDLLGTFESQAPDSFAPLYYEAEVPAKGVARFVIEDVSILDERKYVGPFEVGVAYGEEVESEPVDWAAIRAESGVVRALDRFGGDRALLEAGAALAPARQGGSPEALLLVREAGIHRVTHEQLVAAGVDFSGVPGDALALLDGGVAVPRVVTGPKIFGAGSSVEFHFAPQLTLASPVDALLLRVDRQGALSPRPLKTQAGRPGVAVIESVHRPEKAYSYSSPTGDPWYDSRLLAFGAPASATREFDLPGLADGEVRLVVGGWGFADFNTGSATPDHHVVVRLNGDVVGDEWFDGVTPFELDVEVSDVARELGNVLEVTLPFDTGYTFDHFAFDGFTVTSTRRARATEGRFSGRIEAPGYSAVSGFISGGPVSVWRRAGASVEHESLSALRGTIHVAGGAEIAAAEADAVLEPGIVPAVPVAQASSSAEYVIVTHPVFADDLDELVALQESRGLTTEIVTVDRIYAAYSDHAPSASAVRQFLAASRGRGLRYALLVGADSSDPYDHLGLGSVSYVPTDYVSFNAIVAFSPTDETLADGDGDGIGDFPIGRFPVRTPAELAAVVDKLLDWEARIDSGRSAFLTSGSSNVGSFTLTDLNAGFAQSLSGWSLGTASVDQMGVPATRTALLAAINSGTQLVSYVGHSSMGQWNQTPLLRWQDAASLTNAGAPNLVTAWGCWNSYYVEPTIESLAARLLRKEGGGAAGAIGATTLTSEPSHQALGELFFSQLAGGATRMGDAFHAAKVALAAQGGEVDAILGMTLLGDPAMSVPAAP